MLKVLPPFIIPGTVKDPKCWPLCDHSRSGMISSSLSSFKLLIWGLISKNWINFSSDYDFYNFHSFLLRERRAQKRTVSKLLFFYDKTFETSLLQRLWFLQHTQNLHHSGNRFFSCCWALPKGRLKVTQGFHEEAAISVSQESPFSP